ncbi:MAG: protein jag [Ornithinimicrobium sp.]|uniref:Jag family protein n=1 Tax=Ornithinimicrobium sp. TaxID=1977084 RepID=UPI0017B23310|nr:RNA-binding protein [Actinomycetota bacterium]
MTAHSTDTSSKVEPSTDHPGALSDEAQPEAEDQAPPVTSDGAPSETAGPDPSPDRGPTPEVTSEGTETEAGSTGRTAQLEREGEIAADFLETLLDIADLDGDLEVDIDGDRAAVSIVDSEDGTVTRRLIGKDGEIVEALQELARLSVQADTGERSRLMLDVGGYRAERRATVLAAAKEVIDDVTQSQERRAMSPMTAYERKVVHDEVLKAGLRSESEGEEPQRHVVVLPSS